MNDGNTWDVEITSKNKWFELRLSELIHYKDLVILFVKRNFTVEYKQTILGPLWYIINPLVTTLISTLVFGNIAGIRSDGVPYFLFYLTGFTLWNYFSTCVSTTSSTFTANAAIMGKVYFPRLTMPISSVLYSAINMLIIFVILLITMVVYYCLGVEIHPSIFSVVMVPALMLQTAVFSLSVGIIISALTTKYRDLVILVAFGLNLWMYITPVVYPISEVSSKLRTLILLNPMSAIIHNFRYVVLGIGVFETGYWILSIFMTIAAFLTGVMLFNHVEKTFMDTV